MWFLEEARNDQILDLNVVSGTSQKLPNTGLECGFWKKLVSMFIKQTL
jgi:hypothetical protein